MAQCPRHRQPGDRAQPRRAGRPHHHAAPGGPGAGGWGGADPGGGGLRPNAGREPQQLRGALRARCPAARAAGPSLPGADPPRPVGAAAAGREAAGGAAAAGKGGTPGGGTEPAAGLRSPALAGGARPEPDRGHAQPRRAAGRWRRRRGGPPDAARPAARSLQPACGGTRGRRGVIATGSTTRLAGEDDGAAGAVGMAAGEGPLRTGPNLGGAGGGTGDPGAAGAAPRRSPSGAATGRGAPGATSRVGASGEGRRGGRRRR